MKILCALMFFLAVSNSAHADSYSGADLKRFADAGEAVKKSKEVWIKSGARAYIGHLAGVAKYLKDDPGKLEQPAQLLAVTMRGIAYQCPSAFSPADLT